jgi:FkbM family methyltransferase
VPLLRELIAAPGRFVPGWFPLVADPLSRRLGPHTVVEASIAGSRMRLDPNDYTQRKILFRSFEPREVRVVKHLVRPGDICVDVGANVGFFTLLFARLVGPEGRVMAYEPVPANASALRANLALNGYDRVAVNEVAVGSTQSDLVLGLPTRESRSAATSGHWTAGGTFGSVSARQVVLDDELRGLDVRLVKIDVEGMESSVLAGLRDALAEHRVDALLVEVALAPYAEIAAPLEAAGYHLRTVDPWAKLAGAYNVLATSPRLAGGR